MVNVLTTNTHRGYGVKTLANQNSPHLGKDNEDILINFKHDCIPYFQNDMSGILPYIQYTIQRCL